MSEAHNENPFASPQAPPAGDIPLNDTVWRDGDRFVAPPDAVLPCRCFLCGKPRVKRRRETLHMKPRSTEQAHWREHALGGAVVFIIAISLMVGGAFIINRIPDILLYAIGPVIVIGFLAFSFRLRREPRFTLWLCRRHYLLVVASTWWSSGCLIAYAGFRFANIWFRWDREILPFFYIWMGGVCVLTVLRHRAGDVTCVAETTGVDGLYHVSGASEAFLATLPPWEGSSTSA